jgi:hypothetical protein
MSRRGWGANITNVAQAASAKAERVRALVAKLQGNKIPSDQGDNSRSDIVAMVPIAVEGDSASEDASNADDTNFGVLNQQSNDNLIEATALFDSVISSNGELHAALMWPHIPPRMILPWMVREVCRGRRGPPIRTLFMNMGRPALQALSGVEAKTAQLRARGVYRSGQTGAFAGGEIGPDAHFLMFLGDTGGNSIQSVPLISIVPHAIALNDGIYWRDFDEKTLKGFKRYFSLQRLNSIRKYLDVLSSGSRSPAFAFLLPSHFDAASRKAALAQLPGAIDLAVIDMGMQALQGRNVSELLCDILTELELLRSKPRQILILTDCPLRYSFIRRSLKGQKSHSNVGSKVESHYLVWASRGRGFDSLAAREAASAPVVETIASKECVIATRLWAAARKLGDTNPLTSVLIQGAAALKGMALTACGADAILMPYGDTHDFYHQIKRERHSFEPHYAKAMVLIGEGHGGPWREKIEEDLAAALSLAMALRAETPLMRYLKRMLGNASSDEDIVIVLRHPEDAQQTNDLLLDFLTTPGNFPGRIPDLRVTTPARYAGELTAKRPTTIVWAASASAGMRAFIGDSIAPQHFTLIVAGQDVVALERSLDVVKDISEYAAFRERTILLKEALPRAPTEFGGLGAALHLDPDRSRKALPFSGHGYLLLDGYGQLSASPGSQFYVLDAATQQLHPRDARSLEVGDCVFVMSPAIRDEIEALLREKDERGRTLEQALVDQYKAIVRKGVDDLSQKEGHRITGARIHEMLFEKNPDLPPIGKYAVDYWLQAAEHLDVDTPFAASDPRHLEAFLKLMGAGVLARQMVDAVRVVRHALQRDGYTNRALFDRLLLDPDSLIHTARRVTFERLQSLRDEALENVFPVLAIHLEDVPADASVKQQFEAVAL